MDNNDKSSDSEEIIKRFGSKIEKIIKGRNMRFQISFLNEGIPDAEVILLVETWLDKTKENFKQPIKDGFTSFQPPKDDDK
jgi:hypothetical protein